MKGRHKRPRPVVIHVDGSAKDGRISIGCVAYAPDGTRLVAISKAAGFGTSHTAEWLAIISALEWAVQNHIENLVLVGDSLNAIRQAKGEAKARRGECRYLKRRAERLRSLIPRLHFNWVPREENREADRLSRAGLARA